MEIVWNAMLGDISKKEASQSDHAPYVGTTSPTSGS
jgi:hypothetical protein